MADNTAAGQQQDLPAEETNQDVEVVKSVQNVELGDHEGEKQDNTSGIDGKLVSTKIQALRNSKKLAKTRLTKAKKQLNDLLPSKNAIRRAINKVNSETNIIDKIMFGLKDIYAVSAENEETNTVIETLDKNLKTLGLRLIQ